MSDNLDSTTTSLVTPVVRGLRLLEYIAQGGSTHNLSEVGRLIDVNRVTVMRLLATLEHEGMIEKLPAGGHQVGLRYLTMAACGLVGHDLIGAGRRVVHHLCHTLGFAAYLSIPDGSDITYVLREMPPAGLISLITIGSRVAAWRAAPGQAMLAALSEEQLGTRTDVQLLAQTDAPAYERLLAKLNDVRHKGCVWSHSGLEQGITACAVVITDPVGQPVAALSVAGPTGAFSTELTTNSVEAELIKAGRRLSKIVAA